MSMTANLSKLTRIPVLTLCLLSLSGCFKDVLIIKEPMLPPLELMQDCPVPEFRGRTEADLVGYALTLKKELEICNLKLQKQRQWYRSFDQ